MADVTKGISNPFDSPIPGQSLTDTPGNSAWEHPPQYTDLNEAAEHVWDRLHDPEKLEQLILLLQSGISVEGLVKGVLFSGFMEGKWTVDLGLLLTEIIFNQVVAIGMKAKISNMRILSGDHTNTKFRREHAKMTLDKNQKKEAIEEIKKEIEPMSMGLMAKGEA